MQYSLNYEDFTVVSNVPNSQKLIKPEMSIDEAFGVAAQMEAEAWLDDCDTENAAYTVVPKFKK